ncbi:MAG: clan AA aspartic protease [Chitinophagaceae bacterium]|nr:clan AA aspartic protease [Chitinophagaceae bacterium]
MGLVYADIHIINGGDLEMVRRGYMDKDEVKGMWVNMLVDTGAIMLAINERIQEQLQLPVVERKKAQLANGYIVEYDVVAPVELKFRNRRTSCQAMVLPGDSEPLLGAIPLEDMDVLIHPQTQQLIVNPDHPFYAQMKMKKLIKQRSSSFDSNLYALLHLQ